MIGLDLGRPRARVTVAARGTGAGALRLPPSGCALPGRPAQVLTLDLAAAGPIAVKDAASAWRDVHTPNAVAAGRIATPMHKDGPGRIRPFIPAPPVGRLGTPDDAAPWSSTWRRRRRWYMDGRCA